MAMPDPVTLSLLAKGGMTLLSQLLGNRAQARESRRADRKESMRNMTQALGSSTMGRSTALDRRPPGAAESMLGDPVVQDLVQKLIESKGGALTNALSGLFGGANKINQAARGMGAPGVSGGLNWGGPAFPQGGSPDIDWERLKRGLR